MADRKYRAGSGSACRQCNKAIAAVVGRGHWHRFCSEECRLERRRAKQRAVAMCGVRGCRSRARTPAGSYCHMHYDRVRRNGTTERKPRSGGYMTRGYRVVSAKGHPLAMASGFAYEHRQVAYDAHAGVCPPCHWCSAPLGWADAVVDHLNESKADNRPDNLVVSCNDCNRARGALLPFVLRMGAEAFEHFVRLLRQHRQP